MGTDRTLHSRASITAPPRLVACVHPAKRARKSSHLAGWARGTDCSMKTTLNEIKRHDPCAAGWKKLLRHLGKGRSDDEPLPIATVLDSNGIEDALWCLRAVSGHNRELRLFAVWCARQVERLMTDRRSKDALDVAVRYANNDATTDALTAARDAAWDAAGDAALAAAWDAAGDAAGAAAWAAAEAAAGAAAWDAAWDAARAAQAIELRRVCAAVDAGLDPYPVKAPA